MDTIAINAGEALNEDGQDKKKQKISDTTKAAMATGVAGIAAGVAAKSIADSLKGDIADETSAATGVQSVQTEEVAVENESARPLSRKSTPTM